MGYSEDIMWQAVEFGTPGSLRYRVVYMDKQGRAMSPWHSIPLLTGVNEYHFLCQSPRGTWARFEAADDEEFNPLRICRVKGKPAHFAENCKWNYGMLPQTWADSALNNADYGGIPYDGKPIEVLEIGSRVSHTGEVYKVKILCAFGVISPKSGTLAWKIVAIASDDLMTNTLADVADVNRSLPGTLEEIREWLRTCHCFLAEDEENVFGMNERAAPVETSLKILVEGYAAWQLLHHSLPAPKPWLPQGEVLKPATLESLWSKYTDHLPHHLPIPVCDDGRGVEESGGGSSGGTVGASQGRKLLSFLSSKSRFTRPAFFPASGDKAGGGSSDSKALPRISGRHKSMGNLDQLMAADREQSVIPAQPAVSERRGGGGLEGVPYACRAVSGVQEAGNIDFGTTRQRAGDANENADSRVDGKGSPPPAPKASSGEGADMFRGGGESSEGAVQGEGMKKAMGNEALGGPVTVIPVATVSTQGGKSGWKVGFEVPEEGFGFETALVAPSELDGYGTWAQAEVAGAGGKAQEGEVWKQTPLSPRNVEARVEGECVWRRRGHRATQSVSLQLGEHIAEEAAVAERAKFVRSTSLGADEMAAVMYRLQLGSQADDRGPMYAEVGEGGDMYGREEGAESGAGGGGGRGEESGYGGREGAGGKKTEWRGQEELEEVEYLSDDGEVVVGGGDYGSGVTGRSRDSRSPSNRGGNWEEGAEEEEWSYGEEEEGVEVAGNMRWQGVDADIPVAVVLTAYGSKGGRDVYVDEQEEAAFRVDGSQMESRSSTPPSSGRYGDDFGERVRMGSYGVYEDDYGERRKTFPLSPSLHGNAPRRTGEQIRAERRAEREQEERERRATGSAGVGGDQRGGGREVETWREEEQPHMASKKSAADLQWEEALRQVSKTMGKKVLLKISKEEQAVLDETQRVGEATTRGKTSRRY